jgi:hypothetical protein
MNDGKKAVETDEKSCGSRWKGSRNRWKEPWKQMERAVEADGKAMETVERSRWDFIHVTDGI